MFECNGRHTGLEFGCKLHFRLSATAAHKQGETGSAVAPDDVIGDIGQSAGRRSQVQERRMGLGMQRLQQTARSVQAHYGHISGFRSEEHTSELQSLMRISYAVFCLKKK